MKSGITKQELIDWIDFLYNDLKQFHVLIGGFYFTFNQLDEFQKRREALEGDLKAAINKIHINNQILQKNSINGEEMVLKLENDALKKQSDFIVTEILTLNKHKEPVKLPVNLDEFVYVCNRLAEMKKEVEYFHTFLADEVRQVEKGDEACFFTFIQDMLADVRKMLREEPVINITTDTKK